MIKHFNGSKIMTPGLYVQMRIVMAILNRFAGGIEKIFEKTLGDFVLRVYITRCTCIRS